eukprot:3917722-Ditylum_brightwellii.AAC.1
MKEWTHALVIPPSNTGFVEIVSVQQNYQGSDFMGCTLEFQHVVFRSCVQDADDDMEGIWRQKEDK